MTVGTGSLAAIARQHDAVLYLVALLLQPGKESVNAFPHPVAVPQNVFLFRRQVSASKLIQTYPSDDSISVRKLLFISREWDFRMFPQHTISVMAINDDSLPGYQWLNNPSFRKNICFKLSEFFICQTWNLLSKLRINL